MVVMLLTGGLVSANEGAGTDPLSGKCDTSQGAMIGSNWQECQTFTEKVLDDSRVFNDAEINKLREEIRAILELIATLNVQ